MRKTGSSKFVNLATRFSDSKNNLLFFESENLVLLENLSSLLKMEKSTSNTIAVTQEPVTGTS